MNRSTLPPAGRGLLVSERFVSLQGEGASVGMPAAFLRLGNCNLACTYCDTKYTWDADNYDLSQELSAVSLNDTADWICESAPGRLIVTGGEPLLQHRRLASLFAELDARLALKSKSPLVIEIETNGTVMPSAALSERIDQWNVSPKLSCSGESKERRLIEPVLRHLASLSNTYFKFVVTSDQDVSEVEELIEQFSFSRDRVLMMPEARSADELRQRAPQVAKWAQEASVRYSGRLHLELYGGKRGT